MVNTQKKALCISNDNNADKDEMDKADQITNFTKNGMQNL
ncbi:28853_t:CDS:2 [Gigaspora margarita]|uniref:28853_t:CDS:1 n=1 Tax=Gigaspora margarita TaxID=4874 RepID=A0ABM8W3A5_GIGMA|nr:28853_t:CDS:2 [Gigaspora margarita]